MRTIRTIAVPIALALAAVACGGSDPNDAESASQDAVSESGSASSAEPEPEAAAADETEPAVEPEATTPTEELEEPNPEESDTESAAIEYPITLVDAIGVEHTIEGPSRIGCVSVFCREVLGGLGVQAAASVYRDTEPFYFPVGPPEFVVTNNGDMEAWAGADIDFAVFGAPRSSFHDTAEQFFPLFYLHSPGASSPDLNGLEAAYEGTRLLALLVDRVAEGEQLIDDLQTAMETARSFATPELADRSFVSLFNGDGYRLESGSADEAISSAFCSMLLTVELGYCAEIPGGFSLHEINAEAFLELDPDIIAFQLGAQTVDTRDDQIWERLSAAQNGLAYDSGDRGYRWGYVRSLIWMLQEFIHFTVPEADMPHPGSPDFFVPEESPLLS